MIAKSQIQTAFNNMCGVLKTVTLAFLVLGTVDIIHAQTLPLPARTTDALSGSVVKAKIENLSVENREKEIFKEVMNGNVPEFLRELVPISFSKALGDSIYNVTYYVVPDYLAMGSDHDYFLTPMTPVLAQRIANRLKFILPTKQMVDQIWSNASVKLSPSPIPPSPQMTTIPVMWDHNATVKAQRAEKLQEAPLGTLVSGHKKDIIISNSIYGNSSRRVVIYGWHYLNGDPIQPVYAGHGEFYADYSHGIRLIQDSVLINNKTYHISEVLTNPELAPLFSDERVIDRPYYPLE